MDALTHTPTVENAHAVSVNLCPDCGVPPMLFPYLSGRADCECLNTDCESYDVEHAESWQAALQQWNKNTAKAYSERAESPISTSSDSEPAAVKNRPQDGSECDTRVKLERDIKAEYYMLADEELEPIFGWLDRQAAITQAECERICDTCEWPSLAAQPDQEAYDRIAELTAERDTLQGALDIAVQNESKLEAERDELRERIRKLTMKTMAMDEKRRMDTDNWAGIAHQHQEDLHEIMELREKLREKQHVCDVQRNSFAKLERDNAKLRDTLARVQELVGDAE